MKMTNLNISQHNQKQPLRESVAELRKAVSSSNRRDVLKYERFIDHLEEAERETAKCLLDTLNY